MSFSDFLSKLTGQRPTAPSSEVQKKVGKGGILYPSDLFTDANEAHILFFRKDGVARGGNIKSRIALYMPPQIRVNYGAQWEEIQMTVYQYQDLGKEIYNAAASNFTEKGYSPGANQQIRDSVLRGGANILDFFSSDANLGQQLEVFAGKTVNPHAAMAFKGVYFRTFEFTFQMMARNQEESESIKELIAEFKEGMHPNASESLGRYWEYPDNFDITLFAGKGRDDYMFNVSTSVLTNMSVDYAGSGIPSFFDKTGAPVDIRMTLQFKELELLTRKRIEEGY